ncbi:MAG: hypothetical protein ACREMA_01160 [Longimicrobiales bacterium]
MGKRSPFSFDRLEVYRTAMEFTHVCSKLEDSLPGRKADVRDMLARESTNVLLKIARGSAETRRQAFHTFRQSRRSAEQCHSILDGLRMTEIGSQPHVTAGIELLERVETGLTELIDALSKKLKMEPLPPLGEMPPEPLDEPEQRQDKRDRREKS